ncbi:CGNR zinc finger domain-containing protein [Nocardia sp. IFM 10818]
MFGFVSGNLALDFIGTVKGRRSYAAELLPTPADFGTWTVAAGLLDTAPECDADTLAQAVALREAAYRMALAAMAGEPLALPDRKVVNALAHGALPEITLRADGTVRRVGTADRALTEIARSAIELFGGPDRNRIKECGRSECTRLYVDTSRGGSRRWCDMTVCGNRAKSAAFRARHTEHS